MMDSVAAIIVTTSAVSDNPTIPTLNSPFS